MIALFLVLWAAVGFLVSFTLIILIEQGFGRELDNYHFGILFLGSIIGFLIGLLDCFPY